MGKIVQKDNKDGSTTHTVTSKGGKVQASVTTSNRNNGTVRTDENGNVFIEGAIVGN